MQPILWALFYQLLNLPGNNKETKVVPGQKGWGPLSPIGLHTQYGGSKSKSHCTHTNNFYYEVNLEIAKTVVKKWFTSVNSNRKKINHSTKCTE